MIRGELPAGVIRLLGYLLFRQLDLVAKLRVASVVVAVHALLAWLAPGLESPAALLVWIGLAGVSLGVGVPMTFGMAVDLIPVRHRGFAAATITAVAYFAAAAVAPEWQIDAFSQQLALPMTVGAVGLATLAWLRLPIATPILARMRVGAQRPNHARGRFLRDGRTPRPLLIAYLLAIGTIFFIDSCSSAWRWCTGLRQSGWVLCNAWPTAGATLR